jgi:predicted DNA-binding protein with PD1-like motif
VRSKTRQAACGTNRHKPSRLASMEFLPIRLSPGADLRRALEEAAGTQSTGSAFVVAGIGSLVEASLRYAGKSTEDQLAGPLEILSLSGSLSASGTHLHMSVSDASGRVYGGHVGYGSRVRTTAEVLVAPLPDWSLTREHDATTGFTELLVRRRM